MATQVLQMTEETLANFFEKNVKNSIQTMTEETLANFFEKNIKNSMQTMINESIKPLEERLTSLEHSVAVIEYEHGDKIQILLDSVTGILEKQDEMINSINYLKSKDYDHDVRIAVLEELSGYPYYFKYKK